MYIEQSRELLETPFGTISSLALKEEGSTTIAEASTPKQVEVRDTLWGDDIVWSLGQPKAAKLYKITNKLSNRVYIGYTTLRLNKRINSHFYSARKGSNSFLHKTIRKDGEANFNIELISEHASKESAKEAEVRLIAELRQQGIPLYNLLAGGNGGLYVEDREAWKEKLRKARIGGTPFKGHNHTDETKRICGEASKRRWAKRRVSSDHA